ncbi:leucine-rich repeat-containing protein kinase family protein [Rhodoferax ferrireducens]|uniref:leucine-rich repeat-containing protein kinase family protein n=1 Tax=Rhodoferax ferrireducens TaxID=192843 RepID=UPI003B3B9954
MNPLEQLRCGQLAGSQRVTLACGLQQFPREIFDLADSLEILDLSNNALTQLPPDLPRLHKLRVLFCSDNLFAELPAVLGQCTQLTMVGFKANQIRSVPGQALPPALRWLILTDNQIEELPPEIGRCGQLQKLMLAGNQLRALPPELAACSRLELLRVAANRLSEFPSFLLTLPRLAWLAYAGNPFCEDRETVALAQAPIASIPWDRLQLQQQLGAGASGVIHQAQWINGEDIQPVAVKLFKGTVTSDGLPQCEMTATMSAGGHAHLIPVLGQVLDHPQGVHAMVLSLIDPAWRILAGPPSLDSCTRDIYGDDTSFDMTAALGIALAVASAACHLHAQGLMHGDLYAHNILHSEQGAALLTDFGAASFIAPDDPQQAHALQRLEVRAFACLLEELLARCTPQTDSADAANALAELKTNCMQKDPGARPLFAEIEQVLRTLEQQIHDPRCDSGRDAQGPDQRS